MIVTQIKWKRPFENDGISYANVSMKWNNEDRIITWIDDTALNDFLNQVFLQIHLLNIQQFVLVLKQFREIIELDKFLS